MIQHLILRTIILVALLFANETGAVTFDDELINSPSAWQNGSWQITPLQISDDRLYYRAHQGSAEYLYDVLGWSWPTKKISPEVNTDMVRHHVGQHERKTAFTYVVRQVGESDIFGAVYVTPVNTERRHVPNFIASEFAAELTLWFTEDAEAAHDSDALMQDLIAWIEEEWSFTSVLVPVHSNYTFVHEQMHALEYEAFTEDAETGELLYRLP